MAHTRRVLSFAEVPAKRRKCDADSEWRSLSVSPKELRLKLTLLTGQSFLWKQTTPDEFTGVVDRYLVSLKQTNEDILFRVLNALECPQVEAAGRLPSPTKNQEKNAGAKEALREYFTLDTSLETLWKKFSAADGRFAAVAPYLEGARLLRQDPKECVFQFICSSNNHIQRITQMVDHLAGFGCFLGDVNGHSFYTFPSLEQLALVDEQQLRKAGFGYRAKYIVGAVKALHSKDGGGERWLKSLRNHSLKEATSSLCTLPGIGPKVAACVALFSLDKHQAIPVDTHVWQIAVQHLIPELSNQKLTQKLHSKVAEAFIERFGDYAGWAHTVLFIAELSSHQSLLPLQLRKALRN